MSSTRFGRGREFQFFRREELRTRWDVGNAKRFIGGFRGDTGAMTGFRKIVTGGAAGGAPGTLSDDQVILHIARMLVSGELIVAMPELFREKGHLNVRTDGDLPLAPAKAAKIVEVGEDPPTFESGHDGAAQAAVLIAAARNAFPFCEECQRLAVERGTIQ